MRDAELRQVVVRSLCEQHKRDRDTIIVEEMGIWAGSVRVDIAVINGELCGLELKSDRDTLRRLPGQAALYNQVFDRVTLIVGEKHSRGAIKLIPEWWGLTIATINVRQQIFLELSRLPNTNPAVNPLQLSRMLWRQEALSVLVRHGIDRGLRSRPVEHLARKLSEALPLDTLRDEVRAAMKARSSWLRKSVSDQGEMTLDA